MRSLQSRRLRTAPTRWHVGGLLALTVTFAFAGCGQLDPVTPYEQVTDPAKLYASLAIEYRAINMAVDDTIRLHAVPLDAQGDAMAGLPAPTFSLENINDTSLVTVTPDGLLQAHASTPFSTVRILAELKIAGNVRHTTLAEVAVFDAPIPISSLAFDGATAPDSSRQGMWLSNGDDGYARAGPPLLAPFVLHNLSNPSSPAFPRIRDTNGNLVEGLLVAYATLDPAIAIMREAADLKKTRAETGLLFAGKPGIAGIHPGQVDIVARTIVFGDTLADTLPLTVTWPVVQNIDAMAGTNGAPMFVPTDVVLAPSALVFFQSAIGDSVDVTFDDPTDVGLPATFVCDTMVKYPNVYGAGPNCGTGNLVLPPATPDPTTGVIAGPQVATSRVRQFMIPGVYHYHSVRTGAAGRIVVTNDPNLTSLP